MPIPVLLPARNEADFIGRALASLPNDVEPIVLPNGCTDNTVDIARDYGATIIDGLEEGKLPALQAGISYLGRRATEPFLALDTDSFPLFPRSWARCMVGGLKDLPNGPSVVVGPVLFDGGPGFLANASRAIHRYGRQYSARKDSYAGYFAGVNMLIHARHSRVVDALLNLEHFWPGEDYAIKDAVVEAGGTTYKTAHPFATVVTDASRTPTLREKLFDDKAEITARIKQSYADDRPPGARRYFKAAPQDIIHRAG